MSSRDLLPIRRRGGLRRGEEPFRSLFEEIEDIFDRFFGEYEIEPLRERWGAFTPKLDFVEDEKEYRITAEIPGLEEKDIEVTMDENSITIKGEKKEEKEEKAKNYYYRERRFGSFVRTLPLPEDVDKDKVEAKFKNGLLTLRLPKSKEATKSVKKIEVKKA